MKDILLDNNGDILFVNGDIVFGDALNQDVELLLTTSQGEWKQDPILGCGLIQKMKGNSLSSEIQQIVKLQLLRDGKNYEEIKEKLVINI